MQASISPTLGRGRKRATGRATIADVARLAAVSPMTVSRTLKGPKLVTEELRERVLSAIAELGYVPNVAAQALASARSSTIGVIIPSISNSVFGETLAGIRDCVSAAGYQIIIGETLYSPENERELLLTHLGRGVDGVLVTGIEVPDEVHESFERSQVPMVHMFDLAGRSGASCVGFSQAGIGEAVARYVLERGFRRPAFLAGHLDPRTTKRRDSFRRTLEAAGHRGYLEVLCEENTSVAVGGQLLARLVETRSGCDAVFCGNDDLALGALFECQRRGIAVPGDIAIIGCNDLPFAPFSVPSLTSVTTPRYAIGQEAARLLLCRINGESPGETNLDLGFHLTRRESA